MHKKEKRKPRKRKKRELKETVVDHSTTSLCLRTYEEEEISQKKMTKMTSTLSHWSMVGFQNQKRVHSLGKNLQIQKVLWQIFVRKLKQSDFSALI